VKKDKDFPDTLTVHDTNFGSSDSGESLAIYMKQLQRIPLLSKEEEVSLARQIRTSKGEIIALCVQVPECISEIYLLKELSVTELRKLFFTMIDDEEDGKGEVAGLMKKLETLLTNTLKGKKSSSKSLVEFLLSMSFTLNDLVKLSKPVLEYGTKEQAKSLNKQLALFRSSKNKMVECNLRLVFSRAKLYMNKGLSLEDLLQEGNIGLIKAIEKFDVEKGYKFGTYATWWIDQALGRSVADKGRLIRVPVHMVENINRLTKAQRNLSQKLGRDPNVEELAEHTDISEEKIKKVRKVASLPQSVEEPTGEVGIPLSEYLEDVDSPSPVEMLERKELAQKVRSVLSQLSPREEKIIRMRFGIGEKKSSVLKQIGNQLDISGERVRQIFEKSMQKLSAMPLRGRLENDWIESKGSDETSEGRGRQR
jgi:RNA polymerase primary sigma factor